jgi:hypothetical protein
VIALRWRPILQYRPVRAAEHRSAIEQLEPEASGPVHHPVVSAEHQEEVRKTRLTSIRAVEDVVCGFKGSSQQLPRTSLPVSSIPTSCVACR